MKDWLRTGAMIENYRVVMRIGASSIGEVYQVRDEAQFRDCALKILSSTYGWTDASRQRFTSLLSATPPLNHPNISSILAAGVAQNGSPFVVTELVNGRTLDEIGIGLARTLSDKLFIATQIAEALDAAHQRGVLHLGLKPSNIMLDNHGQVRVLDFAVTLAIQVAVMAHGGKARRLPLEAVRYLSPEQIRGEQLTPQTDIFSLGTIIYELFASQLPFNGRSIDELIQQIQYANPEPLSPEQHEVPASVNPILQKALAKNPAARYRTAGELAQALRKLAETEQTKERTSGKLNTQPLKMPDEAPIPAELLRSKPKISKAYVGALVVLLGCVVALGVGFHRWRKTRPIPLPEEPLPITKLTASGKVLDAVIAPNSQGVAYLIEEAGRHDLLFKPLQGKEKRDRLLFSTKDAQLSNLRFSHDGEFIFYQQTNATSSVLYTITPAGGGNHAVLANVTSPLALAPNAQWYAFVRQTGATTQLVVFDPKRKQERVLATQQSPRLLATNALAWSPDSAQLVCASKSAEQDLTYDLVSYDLATGAEKRLAAGPWVEMGGLAWARKGVLVNGRQLAYPQWQIWLVNPADGTSRALTVGINDYHGLSLNQAATQALTVHHTRNVGLWLGKNEQAVELVSGNDEGLAGLSWLGNEQLVYTSRAKRHETLWQIKSSGGPAALWAGNQTSGALKNFSPALSADGQKLVFAGVQENQPGLWTSDPHTPNVEKLAQAKFALLPQFIAGGHGLLFSSLIEGRAALARWNPADGVTELIRTQQSWGGVPSPDGTQIVCNSFDVASGTWLVSVLPAAGNGPAKQFALPGSAHRLLRWLPDGSGFAYIVTKRGVSNLWQQPLNGNPPTQLTNFTKHRLYNFAWSPDGKQLAVARGKLSTDAVVITDW